MPDRPRFGFDLVVGAFALGFTLSAPEVRADPLNFQAQWIQQMGVEPNQPPTEDTNVLFYQPDYERCGIYTIANVLTGFGWTDYTPARTERLFNSWEIFYPGPSGEGSFMLSGYHKVAPRTYTEVTGFFDRAREIGLEDRELVRATDEELDASGITPQRMAQVLEEWKHDQAEGFAGVASAYIGKDTESHIFTIDEFDGQNIVSRDPP